MQKANRFIFKEINMEHIAVIKRR